MAFKGSSFAGVVPGMGDGHAVVLLPPTGPEVRFRYIDCGAYGEVSHEVVMTAGKLWAGMVFPGPLGEPCPAEPMAGNGHGAGVWIYGTGWVEA